MAKKRNDIDFKKVLKNKRIPILTLDAKWHELFAGYNKPAHIKELEKKLNDLMKSQGQRVNDIKDLKALKKKLMDEIIQNMDVAEGAVGALKAKKQMKSQQLIQDINEKLRQADEALIDLPYQIKAANEELLIESMKICYDRLKYNEAEIERYAEWILKTREELKKNILEKQDMEVENTSIYTYMHDMLGPHVIEELDVSEGFGK